MKERYPFLAYWMKIGINKFPKLVDDPDIFERFLIEHIDRNPAVFKNPCLEKFRANSPTWQNAKPRHQKLLEEEVWETMIRPNLLRPLSESIQRMSQKHLQEDFHKIDDARRQIIDGGMTTTDIAEKLGRDLLSKYHVRGGKVFILETHREIIKLMYGELIHAITKIRQSIDAPCTQRNGPWNGDDNDQTVQILIDKPDCLQIFEEKELPYLTKNLSVSDCSVLIITIRLKSYLPQNLPEIRTLKRILQQR